MLSCLTVSPPPTVRVYWKPPLVSLPVRLYLVLGPLHFSTSSDPPLFFSSPLWADGQHHLVFVPEIHCKIKRMYFGWWKNTSCPCSLHSHKHLYRGKNLKDGGDFNLLKLEQQTLRLLCRQVAMLTDSCSIHVNTHHPRLEPHVPVIWSLDRLHHRHFTPTVSVPLWPTYSPVPAPPTPPPLPSSSEAEHAFWQPPQTRVHSRWSVVL